VKLNKLSNTLNRCFKYIQAHDSIDPMEALAKGQGYSDEAQPLVDTLCSLLEEIASLETRSFRELAIREFRMDELDAVMYSVDKCLPKDYPTGRNPATRAADAREIALRKIEKYLAAAAVKEDAQRRAQNSERR